MSWDELIRPDLAPLVPYAPGLRASQVRERSGKDVVLKLSSNEHPCGPVPLAITAMEAVLHRLNRYPDGACVALTRKLAERFGVPEECVVVTNGSNELLRILAQIVLRPGDEVVFPWPSFVVYPMVTAIFGAKGVKVPLTDGDCLDLDAMLAAITPATRLVFLCNPNNPTGTIYGREAFERFLAGVPEHVLVCVDEAYFEFVTDESYPDGLAYFDGERPIAETRTFSKIYSLAPALGYGIMRRPLQAVHKCRNRSTSTQSARSRPLLLDVEAEVAAGAREPGTEGLPLRASIARCEVAPSETIFVYFLQPSRRASRPTSARADRT